MPSTLDYLTWRGDLLFTERPLNRVDNLIFSHLAYLNLEGLVPGPGEGAPVPLCEVLARYTKAGIDQSRRYQDPGPLLRKAGVCPRFAQVGVGGFVNQVDNDRQIQFAAMTFHLPDGSRYVAFRGTDNSIVGWREDFNTTFLAKTPGQEAAAAYLSAQAACPLYVGGHSKGGNLAMYAAAFCAPSVQDRILKVWTNDGPGFHGEILDAPGYAAILGRAELIVPQDSMVGILLSSKLEPIVIQSSASGPMQHNPATWQVSGTDFVPAQGLSAMSQFLDQTLDRWNEDLTDSQRQTVITAVFDALDASGATTISQINDNRWVCYNAILKAARSMEPQVQKTITDSLKKLASAGKDILFDEAKKVFEKRRPEQISD